MRFHKYDDGNTVWMTAEVAGVLLPYKYDASFYKNVWPENSMIHKMKTSVLDACYMGYDLDLSGEDFSLWPELVEYDTMEDYMKVRATYETAG